MILRNEGVGAESQRSIEMVRILMGKGVIVQSRNVRSLLFDSLIKTKLRRGGYSLSFAQVGLVLFTQIPTESQRNEMFVHDKS